MIYKVVREALESVPELAGKVRPVAECVDDIESPFCIFGRRSSTPVRVMSGATVYTVDVYELGFEAETIDEADALSRAAGALLEDLADTEPEPGLRVLAVGLRQEEPDALNAATGLMRTALTVTLSWQRREAET